MTNRYELDMSLLDRVTGGAIGFNPDGQGTYTMKCQYSGNTYTSVQLGDIMEIAKFAASIPNTAEGEQEIIKFAQEQGYIHNN